ncbi:MAG: hypothetical protein Q8R98_00305 [Rubrivivax sp.]|nr:hypothetical protein [Rubrivivax sp.]
MADGSFDDFDIDEDLDLELEQPLKQGRKKIAAKAPPSTRDLAAELALTLPTDRQALIRIADEALTAYDAAILRDAPRSAEDARMLFEATIYRYNGDSWFASYGGDDAAGYVIAQATSAPPGSPMRWNQKGVMRVEAEGVAAALQCAGGFSLGGRYSWHALELDKPFFSNTGYQSFMSAPIIWGATFSEAALIWMRGVIRSEKSLSVIPEDAFIRTRPLEFGFLNSPVDEASPPRGLMAFPF